MHFNSPLEKQFVSNPIPEGILLGVRSFIAPLYAWPRMRPNLRNQNFQIQFWPGCMRGVLLVLIFFYVLKTCSYALTPTPPPSRTKCAECGHSCWAGLPSVVRVSETPLSRVWYKRGSTLSLDFNAWFYQDMAKATNLLTWLHRLDVARVRIFRLPSCHISLLLWITWLLWTQTCKYVVDASPGTAPPDLTTLNGRKVLWFLFFLKFCSGCFCMDTVFNKLTISLRNTTVMTVAKSHIIMTQ